MRKSRQRNRRRRGYTLTEVMVALAIVSLLAGVGFPAYKRMKGIARSTHCVSNLRQIGIALSSHLADHGMRLPTLVPARDDVNEEIDLNGDGTTDALEVALRTYLSDELCFQCPADHERLWERTGTSYFWNSALNGQDLAAINFLGISKNTAGIPIVADKENFHVNVGDEVNVLYVDGHVTRELRFIVDP